MKLHLLCGQTLPEGTKRGPEQIFVWMDLWDVPEGDFSLPKIMTERLVQIRTEHAQWAFDMAGESCGKSSLEEELKAGSSLSMWWCSTLYERHPKITPALYDVYRLRALEFVLQEHPNVSAIETYGCTREQNESVKSVCRSESRKFEAIQERPGPRKGIVRTLYDKTPPPLRTLARLAVWFAQVKRILKGRAPIEPCDRKTGTVFTYFPNIDMERAKGGEFRSRYFETLHDALAEEAADGKAPAVRWVFIRFPSPQASLEGCKKLCESFTQSGKSGVTFRYIEEFLDWRDLASAFRRYLSLLAASRRLVERAKLLFRFKGSHLDFWPLLKADYEESFQGWRCLERCIQQRGIENYVNAAGPQRFYTFPLENCPWERMVSNAVHEAKTGKVVGAQHSTIRPTDFRYFDDPRAWEQEQALRFQPDLLLGNGEGACRQWREAGVPEKALGKAEALRYLYLAGKPKATPDTGRLLVATSFFADETNAHIELFAKAFLKGVFNGMKITLKPHPYLPVEEKIRQLVGGRADELEFSNKPLSEELAKNPVVWASNSTTVALEAAITGLPVIVMRPAGDFDLCPIQEVPGLLRTSDLSSVETAISEAKPLDIDPDYLCLDTNLPRWKEALGLASSPD